jgi:hypothetical protein
MTSYRYLFADLLTNQINAELNLTSVNFTQQLNASGTFTGELLISDRTLDTANILNSTIPARTALYVDRDGVLVWGGIVWHRTYNAASQRISITASEFESYFDHRVVYNPIAEASVFTNTDQLTIAQTLINNAQALENGNIGVAVPVTTSGKLINRTYYNYELKSVYAALQDLAQQSDGATGGYGFDFNIQVAYDGSGTPTKTLVLGYPQGGTRYSASSVTAPVFEFPAGNMVSYEYAEDGASTANRVWIAGAGSNEGKTLVASSNTAQLTAGWALLDAIDNRTDIADTTTLQNLAAGKLAAIAYPPVTLKIVAPPYKAPVFGSYQIGDDIRVRIRDDFFLNGIDTTYRLVALNVTAGENSGELVTLTLTLPTTS